MIVLRRTNGRASPFVFMTKNQPPLLQIIGRDFDSHAISVSGRISDDLMPAFGSAKAAVLPVPV